MPVGGPGAPAAFLDEVRAVLPPGACAHFLVVGATDRARAVTLAHLVGGVVLTSPLEPSARRRLFGSRREEPTDA